MIWYFVHGASIDNDAGRRSGWHDSPLSELGRRQAVALGAAVEGRRFDAVYCSDLQRAYETAKIAFAGRDLRVDARLREMSYGILDGAPAVEFAPDEQYIEVPRPDGECCRDVERRVRAFLADEVGEGETVAIVSHRFPQLALEVLCHGRTWSQALRDDWRHVGRWQPGWPYPRPQRG